MRRAVVAPAPGVGHDPVGQGFCDKEGGKMALLDEVGPAEHARRYQALRSRAREVAKPTVFEREAAPPGGAPTIRREMIPGGWYATLRLARGRRLRLTAPTGRASVATVMWNAEEVSERLNPGDSMKIQWRAELGFGDLLYSDMGRPMASLVHDSGAGHDALVGASDPAGTAARYGRTDLRNSRDNFRAGAAKLGLDRRDIAGCFTFFAPIAVAADGGLRWRDPGPPPGASVTLRAEMDLLLVLSNCPHPLDPHPDFAPEPIELLVWRGPSTPHDDPCRTRCDEARRAFENLDAWLAERADR